MLHEIDFQVNQKKLNKHFYQNTHHKVIGCLLATERNFKFAPLQTDSL